MNLQYFSLIIFAFIVSFLFQMTSSVTLRASEFNIKPTHPIIGDDVSVSCRLVAPAGLTFYRTEPWLAFDTDSEETYTPYRVGKDDIPGVDKQRYDTRRSPDVNRVNVSVTVRIKNFSLADVGIKISCVVRLHLGWNDFEDVVIYGLLKPAAPPPAPNDLFISFPTHEAMTCHSPLSVSWNSSSDHSDRMVEGSRVSVRVGGPWTTLPPSVHNTSVPTQLDFSLRNATVRARINCWSQAGNSSTALSNTLQLKYPEIRNLTARVDQSHNLHLNWMFSPTPSDWLLDVGYKLNLLYSTANSSDSYHTFTTRFTLLSNINHFNLYYHQLPSESRITRVTLTKYHLCNQKLRYFDTISAISIYSPSTTTHTLSPNFRTSQIPIVNSSESSDIKTSQIPIVNSSESSNIKTSQAPIVSSSESSNIKTSVPDLPTDPDGLTIIGNKFAFNYSTAVYPFSLLLSILLVLVLLIVLVATGIGVGVACCRNKNRANRVQDVHHDVEGGVHAEQVPPPFADPIPPPVADPIPAPIPPPVADPIPDLVPAPAAVPGQEPVHDEINLPEPVHIIPEL